MFDKEDIKKYRLTFVPAAAVIQSVQVLFGVVEFKE